MQLINALVTSWKKSIKEEKANLITLSIFDHHLIKKNNQIFSLNRLSGRELHVQITKNNEKPTSQSNNDSFFCTTNSGWRNIYLFLRKTAITKLRVRSYIQSYVCFNINFK